MKKAVVALYIIIAVQSVIIVLAFVFLFFSTKEGFKVAGAEIIKFADSRYILK